MNVDMVAASAEIGIYLICLIKLLFAYFAGYIHYLFSLLVLRFAFLTILG